jgi:hypothetical protein
MNLTQDKWKEKNKDAILPLQLVLPLDVFKFINHNRTWSIISPSLYIVLLSKVQPVWYLGLVLLLKHSQPHQPIHYDCGQSFFFFCLIFQFCDVTTLGIVQKRNSAKFGYMSERKVENFKNPAIFLQPSGNYFLLCGTFFPNKKFTKIPCWNLFLSLSDENMPPKKNCWLWALRHSRQHLPLYQGTYRWLAFMFSCNLCVLFSQAQEWTHTSIMLFWFFLLDKCLIHDQFFECTFFFPDQSFDLSMV